MTSKVSSENVSPMKIIGDDLNYNLVYNYSSEYAHRLINVGNRYYQYDANGNIVREKDGKFDEETVQYGRVINQETENVYSTDYGWGLYNDESSKTYEVQTYDRTYKWNARNQLISSIDANNQVAYVYGQDGQRTNKYTTSSETVYFNKMWTLHTDSGNSLYGGQYAKNIYLGDTRIVTKLNSGKDPTYQEESQKQYYYHSDHLGSASLISDYNGKEYQRIEYTPYGETWVEKTSNTGNEFLPYKFTGKEIDEETGLYYYGARYLDPKYSLWISADPALGDYIPGVGKATANDIGNLPGMGGAFNHINFNLYHYAGNNPVKYVDPDGRSLSGIIGGLTVLVATSVAINMPTKEEHYARNSLQENYQNSCPKKQDALSSNFEQLGISEGIDKAESMDSYHEQGQGNPVPSGNDKLVKLDPSGAGNGSFELVYDSNENLVTDPVNMGTYNKCDPTQSKIGHFIKDMLPYYLWGNSKDDPTTIMERITGTYIYDVNATKAEANEQRLNDALKEAHIW